MAPTKEGSAITAPASNKTVHPHVVRGTVRVPASKSHTIRALLIAAAADRPTTIANLLDSADTRHCISALQGLGTVVSFVHRGLAGDTVVVTPPRGGLTPGATAPHAPSAPHLNDTAAARVDVGNSGTTLYLLTALAALRHDGIHFDGDASIRRRSAAPLLRALARMGAQIHHDGGGEPGCAPYRVRGPLTPGATVAVESPTSQFLSALLLAAPLVPAPTRGVGTRATTRFDITLLNEHPYIDLTCWWLDRHGIEYHRDGYRSFTVPAGQRYRARDGAVGGDYSSATFWACAAAITGGSVTITGLLPDDPQGDRGVLSILARLGCRVTSESDPRGEHLVTIEGPPTRGGTFDLNAMPDALPALAALAPFCPQPVRLTNVAHARAKETDRIAVVTAELARLGATIHEREDGLDIAPLDPPRRRRLRPRRPPHRDGHRDRRPGRYGARYHHRRRRRRGYLSALLRRSRPPRPRRPRCALAHRRRRRHHAPPRRAHRSCRRRAPRPAP